MNPVLKVVVQVECNASAVNPRTAQGVCFQAIDDAQAFT